MEERKNPPLEFDDICLERDEGCWCCWGNVDFLLPANLFFGVKDTIRADVSKGLQSVVEILRVGSIPLIKIAHLERWASRSIDEEVGLVIPS